LTGQPPRAAEPEQATFLRPATGTTNTPKIGVLLWGNVAPTPCEYGRVSTASAPALVLVSLLGAPSLHLADGAVQPLSRLDAALLALLALDGEQPRDRIASWLWPDTPLKNANLNLRQRLYKLRQASGHELVQAATSLRMAAGVEVDLRAADLPAEGELLGGLDYGDRDLLDAWVQQARHRLLRQRIDSLAGQAALLEQQGALAAGIGLCERIVAQAPWHEHSWRRLMRLHYLRGDRAAAIHTFELFERQVLQEQGSKPSAETLELLATIERTDSAAGAPRTLLPASLMRPPLLVGRQAELQILDKAWNERHAALVTGAGGMGKSRLLAEFVAGRAGVLRVAGRPGDAGMPYALVGHFMLAVIEGHRLKLDTTLRRELARLLPELGEAAAGEGLQTRLWRAVETTVVQAQQQGLQAVVVDDLHFADAASLELLRWLLASPALSGLRWCFAARTGEPGPAAALLEAWLGDSNRVEPVSLQGLQRHQVQQLADSLLLAPWLPCTEGLADALFQHAGGHPFYTLETIKALVLAGPDGGAAPPETAAGRGRRLPVPATVSAMIERRLARLSPPARSLAGLAALAGTRLPPGVAAAVLQRTEVELTALWAELEAAQFMGAQGFVHDLVRECVFSSVSHGLRPGLHAAVAEALQRDGSTEPSRLALHWHQAGQGAQAARCWRQAAAAARVAGRLAEQEDFLQKAAQACAQVGDANGHFEALFEAAACGIVRHGSQTALDQLQALEPLARSAQQRAQWLTLHIQTLLNLARYAEALPLAEQAVALATAGTAAATDALSLHGQALALTGQTDTAISLLQRAAASAAARADPARELVAAGALAHALFAGQQPGQAMVQQQRAVALAHHLGDPAEQANATANLATIAHYAGHAQVGHEAAAQAEKRFQAMQAEGSQRQFNRMMLARCAAHRGRLDEAWHALDLGDEQPPADGAESAGSTMAAMQRIARLGLQSWLGRLDPAEVDRLPIRDDMHPISRAGVLLARARTRLQYGGDLTPAVQALDALGEAHPTLREDPALWMDWSRFCDAPDAVVRLQDMQDRCSRQGAEGLARSLAVRLVERLCSIEPAAAASRALPLATVLDQGLHPATYPPEAWWVLARALHTTHPDRAAHCLQQACRWIKQARLPGAGPHWRRNFEHGNPMNRVVLAAADN